MAVEMCCISAPEQDCAFSDLQKSMCAWRPILLQTIEHLFGLRQLWER